MKVFEIEKKKTDVVFMVMLCLLGFVLFLVGGLVFADRNEPTYKTNYSCEDLRDMIILSIEPGVECVYETSFYGHKYNETTYCTKKYYKENCMGKQIEE